MALASGCIGVSSLTVRVLDLVLSAFSVTDVPRRIVRPVAAIHGVALQVFFGHHPVLASAQDIVSGILIPLIIVVRTPDAIIDTTTNCGENDQTDTG